MILLTKNAVKLEHFRSLEDEDGNALNHNFRPVQPLGDRIVLYTSPLNNDVTNNDISKTANEKRKPKKNSSGKMETISVLFVLFNTLLSTI